jgi:hypothetical protein
MTGGSLLDLVTWEAMEEEEQEVSVGPAGLEGGQLGPQEAAGEVLGGNWMGCEQGVGLQGREVGGPDFEVGVHAGAVEQFFK